MRYVIVYLVKGKAKKYQNKLKNEVGPKFGENHLVDNPIPAHVTIKSPFETKKIEEVESVISEFVKKRKAVDLKIDGFDKFRRFVAFLKIDFGKEGRKVRKDLLKDLEKVKWMKLRGHDLKWKPHVTVSYGNTKESFDGIWNYLAKLKKPKFNLKFDNITLLKKVRGKWKVYKEFEIK
jgi:2'-5' RNA ligase